MKFQRTVVRNNTPNIVVLDGAGGRHRRLPPLEQRDFGDLDGFDLSAATRSGQVSTWKEPSTASFERIGGTLVLGGLVLAALAAVIDDIHPPGVSPDAWQRLVWIAAATIVTLLVFTQVVHGIRSMREVLYCLREHLSLICVLGICFGIPAASIFFFGGGQSLLDGAPSVGLFKRLLQLGFITTASLLPVLLYFFFDHLKSRMILLRIYRDLFRFERRLKTRGEIEAKYGFQLREVYGPERRGRRRLEPGSRWPVLVCAFVVTMGWLAIYLPVGDPGSMTDASIREALAPRPTAPTFAFLGAYFFAMQLISRRYSRGDLKPKVYGYITIRIITVVILSWVLEVISGNESGWTPALAFFAGIVPEEFLTLLREQLALSKRWIGRIVWEREKHPLTKLEGIDLYDRSRLEQEGIVNIEALAHHELINLVLVTRIPVPQLVDWFDQAILYLHTGHDPKDSTRRRLRRFGIRTATDLLVAWKAAEARKELAEFKNLLGRAHEGPARLEVIRDTLLDDEWLGQLKNWRLELQPRELRIAAAPKQAA